MTLTRLTLVTSRAGAACLALVLAGCFEVESRSGQEPGRARLHVATALVSADEGGIVANPDPDAPHAMVRLEVPPGALQEDTEISIWVRLGDALVPQVVQSIELEPRGLVLDEPATIVVDYGPFYEEALLSLLPESSIELFSFVEDPRDDVFHHDTTFRDLEQNLLRARVSRFGSFFAVHPDVRRLALIRPRLRDPSVPIPADEISGRLEAVHNGPLQVFVGRGSLASFFSQPASRNLLVVHGLGDDALGVGTNGSFAPSDPDAAFNPDFQNVVAFEYPSSRSLVEAGRALYAALLGGARDGFGTRILAHGTGGIVVRYALELAHDDAARPGARPDDPRLDRFVDRVVFVATPHRGSDLVTSRFADLLAATEVDDAEFVNGLLELAPDGGTLIDRLERDWQPTSTRYFAIAGNISGSDNDGLVDVSSALEFPEAAHPEAYQVFSGPLYHHIALTALADRSGVVVQSREWLDKRRANERPIVGSVDTPEFAVAPTVTIPFTLSDSDSDACTVSLDYSLDGVHWRDARDHFGRRIVTTLPASPAPGIHHSLTFSTTASGIAVFASLPIRVRLRVADAVGDGTSGQTGAFFVLPSGTVQSGQ